MTDRTLTMPSYVADLVHMPLTRLGLDPFSGDDMIACPLVYEDGTELSIAIMCIAKRGWFWEKAVLLVSLVHLDHDTKAVTVLSSNSMDCPNGPHDLMFVGQISKLVRVLAWSQAATGGMGECVDLPRPLR